MTGQDLRIETRTRPWWVRALLATGLAAATMHSGGAPVVATSPR
jgi:hypothetical protein